MMNHMTLGSSSPNQVQDSQVNDTSEEVVIHRLGGRCATLWSGKIPVAMHQYALRSSSSKKKKNKQKIEELALHSTAHKTAV